MEKRTLVAILLCFGILVLWSVVFAPRQPRAVPAGTPAAAPPTAAPPPGGAPPSEGKAARPEAPPPPRAREVLPEVRTTVERPGLFRAVLTSRGARLASFKLLHPQYTRESGKREPLDLVAGGKLGALDLPFGIASEGDFVLTGVEDFRLTEETADRLTYTFAAPDGRFEVVKRYTFHSDGYLFDLTTTVRNRSDRKGEVKAYLLVTAWQDPKTGTGGGLFSPPVLAQTASCFVNNTLEGKRPRDLPQPVGRSGQVSWVGVNEQYFLLAAFPRKPGPAECVLSGKAAEGVSIASMGFPTATVAPGGEVVFSYGLYVGPKEFDRLQAIGHHLDASVDFWVVGFLARPMLWLMKLFHGWSGNWGVAILLLTLVVKALLYPWTQKSFKSMKEMQKLKPRMDEIRQRYASDKARQNQEMYALFRAHKVNPLGGCLPMLLQLPVWIALYRAISASVELYHAPLGLWVQDLAAPDPYFVLPILLGVVTFLQQKLTPTTMDPVQAKMMLWMMPVLFTGFMLFLPSGLVLYILANSVLSIGQQWYINRRFA